MLRRDRQLRTQICQLKDAGLFALSLWLAHLWRSHFPAHILFFKFEAIDSFDAFVWLYLLIIPGAPLVLESQGFYQRSISATRRETAWLLFKGCLVTAVGVILFLFLFRYSLARGVIVLFAAISYVLVLLSEEMIRIFYRSSFGSMQLKKRMLLLGASIDRVRLREEFRSKGIENIELVGELDLTLA